MNTPWTFETFWPAFQAEWRTRHPQTPEQRAVADDGLQATIHGLHVRIDPLPNHESLHVRIPAPSSNRGIAHTATPILRLDIYLPVTNRDSHASVAAVLTFLTHLASV